MQKPKRHSSRHQGDVYKWLEKIVESCSTIEHLISVRKLIWNYSDMYDDHDGAWALRDLADRTVLIGRDKS